MKPENDSSVVFGGEPEIDLQQLVVNMSCTVVPAFR